MSFKCKISLHTWNGCKCKECGKTRDEQHDFSEDCEKCSKCGKTRENQHDWNGCRCKICAKTRNEQHDWSKDYERCSKCYERRKDKHDWSKDCEVCCNCNQTLTDQFRLGMHKKNINHLGYCSKCEMQLEGIFIDNRDKHAYKWIKIGKQIIMTENFAYKPQRGKYWACANDQSSVIKYGYLYDWETANKIAPSGWHLPTKEDWELFCNYSGQYTNKFFDGVQEGGILGFNALLIGYCTNEGIFERKDKETRFWSATKCGNSTVHNFKCSLYTYSHTDAYETDRYGFSDSWEDHSDIAQMDSNASPNYGYSVRLFRD